MTVDKAEIADIRHNVKDIKRHLHGLYELVGRTDPRVDAFIKDIHGHLEDILLGLKEAE